MMEVANKGDGDVKYEVGHFFIHLFIYLLFIYLSCGMDVWLSIVKNFLLTVA